MAGVSSSDEGWHYQVAISGRRSGKASLQRNALLVALADGHEVHVAARDGLWRVTATGIGPLWEKIRQPCPDRRSPQRRSVRL
jgi:hypothetical protein